MRLKKQTILGILTLLMLWTGYAQAIPAFPGAEGFGKDTIGGRGGKVIKVTNLNDSGPGSFRDAVTALGPRIVVFEVSGIINLASDLDIKNPFLTIAGETSPGGILVTGRQTTIKTHDVIMRHMRFRVGSHRIADGASGEQLDSFDIWGKYWGQNDAYNIIVDHSSFSWGVDETFTITGGVTNTTVQWSIVSEGLSHAGHPKGEHSKGLMVSGKYTYPNSVSLHHNYIAHNNDRSPYIEGIGGAVIVDAVNNISYNWFGGNAPKGTRAAKVNWVHNYSKQGVDSNDYSFEVTGSNPEELIYVFGNIGSTRLSQSDPQWNVGDGWTSTPLSSIWQKPEPWPVPPVTTSVMSDSVASCILSAVGATAPVRDSVDTRVVNDFLNSTGKIIDNVTYPDDFPIFSSPPPPTDVDNDGMADSWETLNGLNVGSNDSAMDKDGDGYTNIEEYLHYLSNKSITKNSICMSGDLNPPAAPTGLKVLP